MQMTKALKDKSSVNHFVQETSQITMIQNQMRPTCTPTFSHLDKKLVNIDYRSRDTYARKLSLSEFHDCLIFECSR